MEAKKILHKHLKFGNPHSPQDFISDCKRWVFFDHVIGAMEEYAQQENQPSEQISVEQRVSQRCEGMRRHGGVFSLGPVTWRQCADNAVVILKVKQKGEKAKEIPSCLQCWKEAQDPRWDIKILNAKPLATSR